MKIKVGFLASSFVNRHGSGTGKHFAIVTKMLCEDFNSQVEVTLFCNNHDQVLALKKDQNYHKSFLNYGLDDLSQFPFTEGNKTKFAL